MQGSITQPWSLHTAALTTLPLNHIYCNESKRMLDIYKISEGDCVRGGGGRFINKYGVIEFTSFYIFIS